MLAEYLRFRGYRVIEASSGAEAVTLARELKPRVVLMDLTMPALDGWKATRLLKSDPATKGIVVIAVTANALSLDEARARRAGCDGYIPKPYDLKQLADVVNRSLRSANRRRRPQA